MAADRTQVGARNVRAEEASSLVQSAAGHLIDNAQHKSTDPSGMATRTQVAGIPLGEIAGPEVLECQKEPASRSPLREIKSHSG